MVQGEEDHDPIVHQPEDSVRSKYKLLILSTVALPKVLNSEGILV